MLNRSYAKIKSGGAAIDYAPAVPVVNGSYCVAPTAADYTAAAGGPFYPLANNPPPSDPPQGYHYEPTGWELRPDSSAPSGVYRVYAAVQDPPPLPRRWTRLSLKTALATAQMLDAARQYLASVEVATDYTAWEALTDADYIEEGFGGAEKWNAILDGAAVALGKTRAEIDAFLAAVPTEGGV